MLLTRKKAAFIKLFGDLLAAAISWIALFAFRKMVIEANPFDWSLFTNDTNFFLGVSLIPLLWVGFYFLAGNYTRLYRKSRLVELFKLLIYSLLGTLILFFALLLDDLVYDYRNYYKSFAVLFGTHFVLTSSFRILLLTAIHRQLIKGKIGYNTIILGSNDRAKKLFHELNDDPKSFGYLLKGFVQIVEKPINGLSEHLPYLGQLSELRTLVETHQIEEAIIALESTEHHKINSIMNDLADVPITIGIIPDMYDILSGSVKINRVSGTMLLEIDPELMPRWQKVIKRGFDIVASASALIVLSPLLAYVAIRVRLSSEGSIFYSQERIGIHGKPFKIYKFRSMVQNAEASGPALSSSNDSRITEWGKTMRKMRLDEFPQFYNVLIGDMSLVGPRPERQFFIDQIVKKAPHYKHLNKIKPGITSLGQVKFGYAENVDEMVERLKWDLLYLENISFTFDLKILAYTVMTVLGGKGK